MSPKQHITTHHARLGFDFISVCLLLRRDPPRAIAYAETEKEAQDSYGCQKDQASGTSGRALRNS